MAAHSLTSLQRYLTTGAASQVNINLYEKKMVMGHKARENPTQAKIECNASNGHFPVYWCNLMKRHLSLYYAPNNISFYKRRYNNQAGT